jgi:ATP-dependent Clp protease ATP-binding subunit ClpA
MKGDCLFLNMNVGALQSGCTLVGQFEKKLITIIDSIASYNSLSKDKKVCLFVDEIHALWSVGRNQISGSVSAADIIKPYLSNGTIIILGATTEEEYEEFLMKDKALLRRVSPIFIDDMGPEDTKSVIEAFCDGELDDSMLSECVERSLAIEGAHNPDCAIEIADRAMARALYFKRLVQPQDIDIAAKGLTERRKDG